MTKFKLLLTVLLLTTSCYREVKIPSETVLAAQKQASSPHLMGGASFPSSVPLSSLTQSGASVAQAIEWNGSNWIPATPISGVSGSAPISSTGGTSPVISISSATTSSLGSIELAGDLAGTATSPVVQSATGSGGTFPVSAATVTNLTSTGNGSYTAQLNVTTASTSANTSMTYALPSNTGGNVAVIISGHVPATASVFSETFVGNVSNNGGACVVMATGGAFTQQGALGQNLSPMTSATASVGLTSCNVVVTVTPGSSASTKWSSTVQYISAE